MRENLSTALNKFIKQSKTRGILGKADVAPGVAQTQGFEVFDDLKDLLKREKDEQTDRFLNLEANKQDHPR